MATSAARDVENRVARIIFDAGGIIVAKDVDGSGHNRWTYRHNGHERSFHFAKTPAAMGRGTKNHYARLRREIRELAKLPPPPAPAAPEPKPKRKRKTLVAPLVKPTPPKPDKMTKPRRKEMVKAFLSMGSLAEFMEKFGLGRRAAQNMLLSSRGQSAEKLRKELDLEAAEAAKRRRAKLEKQQRTKRGTNKSLAKRNRLVYTYCKYGLSHKEAAEVFHLTAERIRQIVRAEEKRDDIS